MLLLKKASGHPLFFSKHGIYKGTIKHSWKERDLSYLSQPKHCFGKEKPLKQLAPAW